MLWMFTIQSYEDLNIMLQKIADRQVASHSLRADLLIGMMEATEPAIKDFVSFKTSDATRKHMYSATWIEHQPAPTPSMCKDRWWEVKVSRKTVKILGTA
jgi:hypothetical protein